jgi:hypothetical protein
MLDWEAELTTLLRELGVLLEEDEPAAGLTALAPAPAAAPQSLPAVESAGAGTLDGDVALPLDLPEDQPPAEGDEISAVRREIEATLARVVSLTRAGLLEPALRDDVVFVLQALTRPRPAALRPRERTEWQLASAAAVLHFCRVVLRLTHALAPEVDS